MPFIRHTRDKRGYESLYVMHAYRPMPDAPHRTRVLYLFRSPGQLKVGRQPLDAEVMEALEHTHPDVSFDWAALTRERAAARPAPPERGPRSGPPQAARRPRPAPAPADESVLSRVLGAGEAGTLRRRYAELRDRVQRRARTPEDRDRLLERLARLNPDDWADEAAVRAAAPAAQTEFSAIAAEVPGRRRGRRGGRRRAEAADRAAGLDAGAPDSGSAIMDEGEADHDGFEAAQVDRPGADPGPDGDGPGSADDPSGDSEGPAGPAADPGLHDDDGTDHD